MRKNQHSRILKKTLKGQHISIVPKSWPIYIYIWDEFKLHLV